MHGYKWSFCLRTFRRVYTLTVYLDAWQHPHNTPTTDLNNFNPQQTLLQLNVWEKVTLCGLTISEFFLYENMERSPISRHQLCCLVGPTEIKKVANATLHCHGVRSEPGSVPRQSPCRSLHTAPKTQHQSVAVYLTLTLAMWGYLSSWINSPAMDYKD